MLQRQQAVTVIAARQKIVEGAVSMVKMAIDRLDEDGVVVLDDERKAAMEQEIPEKEKNIKAIKRTKQYNKVLEKVLLGCDIGTFMLKWHGYKVKNKKVKTSYRGIFER